MTAFSSRLQLYSTGNQSLVCQGAKRRSLSLVLMRRQSAKDAGPGGSVPAVHFTWRGKIWLASLGCFGCEFLIFDGISDGLTV